MRDQDRLRIEELEALNSALNEKLIDAQHHIGLLEGCEKRARQKVFALTYELEWQLDRNVMLTEKVEAAEEAVYKRGVEDERRRCEASGSAAQAILQQRIAALEDAQSSSKVHLTGMDDPARLVSTEYTALFDFANGDSAQCDEEVENAAE